MPDDRTVKKVFLGKPDGRKMNKSRKAKIKVVRWVSSDGVRKQKDRCM
jgi:hypothetical protein